MNFYIDIVKTAKLESEDRQTIRLNLGKDFPTANASYNLICGHNLYNDEDIIAFKLVVIDQGITMVLQRASLSGKNGT